MMGIVVRTRGATFGRVASALVSALRAAAPPMVYPLIPDLKHGAVRIVGGELRAEERGDILEGCRAVTIAAATLFDGLAVRFL